MSYFIYITYEWYFKNLQILRKKIMINIFKSISNNINKIKYNDNNSYLFYIFSLLEERLKKLFKVYLKHNPTQESGQ